MPKPPKSAPKFDLVSVNVAKCEDRDSFKRLLDSYHAAFSPVGPFEHELIDFLVSHHWRLQRGLNLATRMTGAQDCVALPEIARQLSWNSRQFNRTLKMILEIRRSPRPDPPSPAKILPFPSTRKAA